VINLCVYRSEVENHMEVFRQMDVNAPKAMLWLAARSDRLAQEKGHWFFTPSGIFDARYGSGQLVEALGSEKTILISLDKYPITIKAEGLNITVRDRINGNLLNEELNNGEEIRITNNKITSIEVTGRITGGLPVSYELSQNYPNRNKN
jgi:hypothetical protein